MPVDSLTAEQQAEIRALGERARGMRTSPLDLLGGIPGALFRAAKGYSRGGYRRKGSSKKKGKSTGKRTKKQSTSRSKRSRAYAASDMSE